jgi:hypothetical protein
VLASPLASSVFDQNAAHRFCGGGKKVFPAVPALRRVHIDHAQVGFVNQGRRLKCLARFLLS